MKLTLASLVLRKIQCIYLSSYSSRRESHRETDHCDHGGFQLYLLNKDVAYIYLYRKVKEVVSDKRSGATTGLRWLALC